MAATRYLGDRTRIVVTWAPRRVWDSPWIQGAYDLVFYDVQKRRELWEPPGSTLPKRHVTQRSFDLHVFVDREEGRTYSSSGLRGVSVTLAELGFQRPPMPFYVDAQGHHHIYDERDLTAPFSSDPCVVARKGCRSHEDCRSDRMLSLRCGEEQLARMRAEDDVREKLLGSPKAIDAIVRIILTKIAGATREQLGSQDWWNTEGVRDDLAKYGVLALRRQIEKPKHRQKV